MKIKATLVGGDRAIARFKAMPDKLRAELRVGISRAVLLVQREVKQNKLNGQVLRRKSTRLSRSINTRVETSGDKVTGTVGTNVEYAAVHEYGFEGTVTVREHLRNVVKSGRQAIVRAHTMHMNLPEKSFLRSALADMRPEIRAELESAMNRAMRL